MVWVSEWTRESENQTQEVIKFYDSFFVRNNTRFVLVNNWCGQSLNGKFFQIARYIVNSTQRWDPEEKELLLNREWKL